MIEKNIVFYKGKAKDFPYFANSIEDKYYGYKLIDVIEELKNKRSL